MTRSQVLQALMQELAARRSEPLSRHTFVQVGGEADWFVTIRDRESLIAAVRAAHCAGVSLTVLGAGSNVLIRDGGIRGVVLKNESRGCEQVGEGRIEVESGARFAVLARSTARAGLAGLEWAAGIPGAIGGGLPTNAGAYGSDLSEVLVSVKTISPEGEIVELPADALGLRYPRLGAARRESGGTYRDIADPSAPFRRCLRVAGGDRPGRISAQGECTDRTFTRLDLQEPDPRLQNRGRVDRGRRAEGNPNRRSAGVRAARQLHPQR